MSTHLHDLAAHRIRLLACRSLRRDRFSGRCDTVRKHAVVSAVWKAAICLPSAVRCSSQHSQHSSEQDHTSVCGETSGAKASFSYTVHCAAEMPWRWGISVLWEPPISQRCLKASLYGQFSTWTPSRARFCFLACTRGAVKARSRGRLSGPLGVERHATFPQIP